MTDQNAAYLAQIEKSKSKEKFPKSDHGPESKDNHEKLKEEVDEWHNKFTECLASKKELQKELNTVKEDLEEKKLALA